MDKLMDTLVVHEVFDVEKLLRDRLWQPLREGVQMSPIYDDGNGGARAAFLHYLPGAVVDAHVHGGYEHILILDGAQADDVRQYETGDLTVQPPGTRHRVTSAGGCVALAIWERPVQFD